MHLTIGKDGYNYGFVQLNLYGYNEMELNSLEEKLD